MNLQSLPGSNEADMTAILSEKEMDSVELYLNRF